MRDRRPTTSEIFRDAQRRFSPSNCSPRLVTRSKPTMLRASPVYLQSPAVQSSPDEHQAARQRSSASRATCAHVCNFQRSISRIGNRPCAGNEVFDPALEDNVMAAAKVGENINESVASGNRATGLSDLVDVFVQFAAGLHSDSQCLSAGYFGDAKLAADDLAGDFGGGSIIGRLDEVGRAERFHFLTFILSVAEDRSARSNIHRYAVNIAARYKLSTPIFEAEKP